VSKRQDLDTPLVDIKSQFGGLDIVFANAGVFIAAPRQQTTEQFCQDTFDINVKGVFFTTQKAEPLLRDGGAIVINASTVIYAGMPNASLYSASKAAVRQLARNLSNELAPRNIRVNVLGPGYTRTPVIGRATTTGKSRASSATCRARCRCAAPASPRKLPRPSSSALPTIPATW
jgi:NAD(P)-dependent dehydrogenase (short-subunit alcohol dehydrogenase family)